MPTMALKVSGASCRVSTAKKTSTITVAAITATMIPAPDFVSVRRRSVAMPTRRTIKSLQPLG
jgi:hypothetical protein